MKKIRRNQEINSTKIRLILEEENILINLDDAIHKAKSQGLDLVEISDGGDYPICKLLKYEKFLYSFHKKEKKKIQKNKALLMKEIQVGLKIGQGDLDIKTKKMEKFLEEGHKVRIIIQLRYRHKKIWDDGLSIMDKIIESVKDIGAPIEKPSQESKRIICTFSKITNKTKKVDSTLDASDNIINTPLETLEVKDK